MNEFLNNLGVYIAPLLDYLHLTSYYEIAHESCALIGAIWVLLKIVRIIFFLQEWSRPKMETPK